MKRFVMRFPDLKIYRKMARFRGLLKCGIAGENRPTGAKFPMEIIDL